MISEKITFREVAGTRPFLDVSLNGVAFQFMVHANASFYAMTTHANAAKAGIGPLESQRHYGITAPGEVSALGMAATTVRELQVGGDVVGDAELVVFEVPQEPVMEGMLGIGWLKDRRAFVDYAEGRVGLPQSSEEAAAEREALVTRGWSPLDLVWQDGFDAFRIEVSVNGISARFGVSTVAALIIDAPFCELAGIPTGPVVDFFSGPTGTRGEVRTTPDVVDVTIKGTLAASVDAVVYDLYAYNATERPSAPEDIISGYLGADFMLANNAVIDFGAGILFLKRAD